jgi:hypothetical protein
MRAQCKSGAGGKEVDREHLTDNRKRREERRGKEEKKKRRKEGRGVTGCLL